MSGMFDPVCLLKQLCGRRATAGAHDEAEQVAEAAEAAPVSDDDSLASRYQACGILCRAGIPLCIWFEDALERFGVPTMTFCLFLVVPGPQLAQAANHLERAGYKKRAPTLALSDIPQFENIYGPEPPRQAADLVAEPESQAGDVSPVDSDIELVDSSHPPVILLSADEWFYELPQTVAETQDCFPTLPRFLTSLVSKWLALTEDDDLLRVRLAVQIEYIYSYVDEVKQPGFENNLSQHLRGFHLDGVNATEPRELETLATQKRYLEQIRDTGSAVDGGEQGKVS